jgi:hypothetical protein
MKPICDYSTQKKAGDLETKRPVRSLPPSILSENLTGPALPMGGIPIHNRNANCLCSVAGGSGPAMRESL